MRAACREFLTHPALTDIPTMRDFRGWGTWPQEEFLIGLGRLRSVFGQQLALLGYLYGIDIEEQLAKTLPPVPGLERMMPSAEKAGAHFETDPLKRSNSVVTVVPFVRQSETQTVRAIHEPSEFHGQG
jgi:hypothetical protein